jgi:hypothetical protein
MPRAAILVAAVAPALGLVTAPAPAASAITGRHQYLLRRHRPASSLIT